MAAHTSQAKMRPEERALDLGEAGVRAALLPVAGFDVRDEEPAPPEDVRRDAGALPPADFEVRFGDRAAMSECENSRRSASEQVNGTVPYRILALPGRASTPMSQVDP